jgi:lysophospholipase L1-like esterase
MKQQKYFGETCTVKFSTEHGIVKRLGRTTVLETGIVCDHSASGIEFCIKANGDVTLDLVTSGVKPGCTTTYFTVYIDGIRQEKRFETEPGESQLVIASFDDSKAHTVRVVTQTESNYTLTEMTGLSFEGIMLDSPEDNDLFVEFIGDSLTCGMGNIGDNSSPDPQTPIWEDATQGYAYMIAEALEADYSIVSQSGIGIAGSWFDPLFDYYTKSSYSRDKETDHDFTTRIPDVIVINLGTNDYYINKDKDPELCKPEEVEVKTEEFIKLVRECYGEDVPIIWVHGLVGTFLYSNIEAAINKLGGKDADIHICEVPKNTGGAQWHPDVNGHKAAAEVLLPVIKKIL